jgi:hypothetical protein
VPWWRGKCTPPHYIKEGPKEERSTQHEPPALRSLLDAPPSSTSLTSPSHVPPEGMHRSKTTLRCTPSSCRVFGSGPKPSISEILDELGIPRFVLITIRVRVRGGAATCGIGVVAPSSSMTLRSATSSSSTTHMRERKLPCSVYNGMSPKHQLIITILLVYRSFGQFGVA